MDTFVIKQNISCNECGGNMYYANKLGIVNYGEDHFAPICPSCLVAYRKNGSFRKITWDKLDDYERNYVERLRSYVKKEKLKIILS